MTQTDNWLDSLKPGDEVFITNGYTGTDRETIAKVTATQIVLAGRTIRFNRHTGHAVGLKGYDTPTLYPITNLRCMRRWLQGEIDDVRQDIKRRAAEVMSVEQLQACLAALQEARKHLKESNGDA